MTSRRTSLLFVGWFLVGAAYALSLLAIFTIGILVLPFAVGFMIFLALRPGTLRGLPGAISGFGAPAILVAYLNRSGPGDSCSLNGCTSQLNPWPWLAVGALFVLAGVLVFLGVELRVRHTAARSIAGS